MEGRLVFIYGAGFRTSIAGKLGLGCLKLESYERQMEDIRRMESGELTAELEALLAGDQTH